MPTLCRINHFQWNGQYYPIHVYERVLESSRRSYSAETTIASGDKIITDALTLEEVSERHKEWLVYALEARVLVEKRLIKVFASNNLS